MKLIVTLLATVAVVMTCNNSNVNVVSCNEKQCNQPYIDNYAACKCRRSLTLFYEHSVNVEDLLRRCGVAGLTNSFGNPYQYRPGQGTQTFVPSGTSVIGGVGGATCIFNGTTYYGDSTTVISGTTRIVSATAVVNSTWIAPGTPGIVSGASTIWVGTQTAAPIEAPAATETVKPIRQQDNRMSGGAIAGSVIGSLAAIALASLLGWCWRKKRAEHTTLTSNPTSYNTSSTATTTNTTSNGYNPQPRTGSVLDSVSNGLHSTANTAGNAVGSGVNAVGHGVNSADHAVGSGVNTAGNTVGNGINSVGNGIRGVGHSAGNASH
ncbi:hypothetical protein BGW39_001165 [Mortierella sp. 14UC]|nr:hypothetical protein BGW39_001165 [Mortierella sp. 14UC]